MRIRWLRPAREDALQIADTISVDNPAVAWAVYGHIHVRVEGLADHPEIGRRGRLQGTRELVITRAPYLVIYRLRRETIEILRVLHQRQQWP